MNPIKKWLLQGEIDTIEMKLLVPGPLARIPNWRQNLESQLREKEDLMRD